MNIGEAIKKLRLENKMSMRELAERVNVTHAHISKLEGGLTSPSVDFIETLAAFFNVPISYFFEEESIINKGKVVKGNLLLRFIEKHDGYLLWSLNEETGNEQSISIKDIRLEKWYYIDNFGKNIHLTEVTSVVSDDELEDLLK